MDNLNVVVTACHFFHFSSLSRKETYFVKTSMYVNPQMFKQTTQVHFAARTKSKLKLQKKNLPRFSSPRLCDTLEIAKQKGPIYGRSPRRRRHRTTLSSLFAACHARNNGVDASGS